MKDGEILSAFQSFSQAITTQGHSVTIQFQAIMSLENKEFGARVHQNVGTMSSRLRGFTKMKSLIFFGSKFNEDPNNFLIRFTRSYILLE